MVGLDGEITIHEEVVLGCIKLKIKEKTMSYLTEEALYAIGIVDYDIMKECQEQLDTDDDCDMVGEMKNFLRELLEKHKKAGRE